MLWGAFVNLLLNEIYVISLSLTYSASGATLFINTEFHQAALEVNYDKPRAPER